MDSIQLLDLSPGHALRRPLQCEITKRTKERIPHVTNLSNRPRCRHCPVHFFAPYLFETLPCRFVGAAFLKRICQHQSILDRHGASLSKVWSGCVGRIASQANPSGRPLRERLQVAYVRPQYVFGWRLVQQPNPLRKVGAKQCLCMSFRLVCRARPSGGRIEGHVPVEIICINLRESYSTSLRPYFIGLMIGFSRKNAGAMCDRPVRRRSRVSLLPSQPRYSPYLRIDSIRSNNDRGCAGRAIRKTGKDLIAALVHGVDFATEMNRVRRKLFVKQALQHTAMKRDRLESKSLCNPRHVGGLDFAGF